MKTKFFQIAIVFGLTAFLFGCSTVQTFRTTNINNTESACKSPVYVATVAKTALEMGNNLGYYDLTKWAQTNFGSEASVQNVFWTVKAGQKINVVFDVVKCGKPVEN